MKSKKNNNSLKRRNKTYSSQIRWGLLKSHCGMNRSELGRSYKGLFHPGVPICKYLSKGDRSKILAVSDIRPVCSKKGMEAENKELLLLQSVTIVGVPELETHKICFRRRSKVEAYSQSIPQLGCCSKFTAR